jgi:hypothetical protein
LDDEGKEEDDILVFSQREIPPRPAPEEPRSIDKSLAYITDDQIRNLAEVFLKDVDSWKDQRITKVPISWGISLKVAGKVFAYLTPTRKSFTISYYNEAGAWADYKVTSAESLGEAEKLARQSYESKVKP